MIYSYRTQDSDISAFHSGGWGHFSITITNNLVVEESHVETTPFELYHGWLMWTAWGVLGFVQLISNRYLRVYWKINRWVHLVSGLIILVLTFAFGLLIMKEIGWKIIKDWHPIIGFLVLLSVGMIAIGGLFSGVLMNSIRWKTGAVMRIKKMHKVNFEKLNFLLGLRIHVDFLVLSQHPHWRALLQRLDRVQR